MSLSAKAAYRKAVYVLEIDVPGLPDQVFAHLVALSRWWPEEYLGDPIGSGTEFIFRIGDSHFSRNKVIEFIPGEKLAWLTTESCRAADGYDWSGTRFIFSLEPLGESTRLRFTYDGVVLVNEWDKLVQVCDVTMKERFSNYLMNGKTNEFQTKP